MNSRAATVPGSVPGLHETDGKVARKVDGKNTRKDWEVSTQVHTVTTQKWNGIQEVESSILFGSTW